MENNNEKFKIVSKVYGKDFKTVTFVIFNSETGELRKQLINNESSNVKTFGERNVKAPEDNDQDSRKKILDEMNKEVGNFCKGLFAGRVQ